MLSPFSLLPLLEGWDYRVYASTETVRRGQPPKLAKTVKLPGWLLGISMYTNDAFATLSVRWRGPGGTEWLIREFTPQEGYDLGAVSQDPAGWLQLYNRPDPASTAGEYFIVPFSGGFQGSPFPYVPDVGVEVFLKEESTQPVAVIIVEAMVIVIVDKESFIKSLQEIIGISPLIEPLERLLKRG